MTARLLVPALILSATLAAPAAANPAAAKITGSGVDGVKVGASYVALRHAHKLAKATRGCELAGPQARAARLLSPLKGSVNLTMANPRHVQTILITGGAKAKGVGIGSKLASVKAKFPHVTVDHGTDSTFGISVARVPKRDGGKFEFAIDVKTHKVTLIGIPGLAFCE
jgi:hypothetical protein